MILTIAWVRLLVTLKVKPVSPSFTMAAISFRSITSRVRRRIAIRLRRNSSAHSALAVCEITVASAAPRIPIPQV